MGDRKINRDAWARLVDSLVTSEARGKKATFARIVGVDPRTISRWINSEVDVSEESVREVARRLNRSPRELLVKVGYYSPDELHADTARPARDPALERILAASVSDGAKQRMVERLQEIRAAQAARELDEVDWWLSQASEGA